MPYNKFYKPEYTAAECKECFAWFEKRKDILPQRLTVPPSMEIEDLHYTVRKMLIILRKRMPQVKIYNGLFSQLLYIRELLQQQGME